MIIKGEDITAVDYSGVTDMSYMFASCTNLETIPDMDTSNITDMNRMFRDCSSLKTIPNEHF